MASFAGFRSQTLILMVFFCILVFLCLVVLLFVRSHWPFTEVVRKIGRVVTRKSDGPTVAQRSRDRSEGLRAFWGPRTCDTPETIPLPKSRMIRHNSR